VPIDQLFSTAVAEPIAPAWPEERSADHLASYLAGVTRQDMTEPRFALTHDLDTPASHAIAWCQAASEAELGHRATYFIVGRDLRRASRLVRRLRELGHEVALHGWCHDVRLPALGGGPLRRRIQRLVGAATALGGRVGHRAPALLDSPAARKLLSASGVFAYDSSQPATDRSSLLGRPRGTGGCLPYIRGQLAVVPISAPLEDILLAAGWRATAIVALYRTLVARTLDEGGWRVIATHLEPHTGGSPSFRAAQHAWLADPATPRSRPLGEHVAAASLASEP
jgi:peptidoglycan/xylan/chitin deacetylase (PgdA/CDA1 family)